MMLLEEQKPRLHGSDYLEVRAAFLRGYAKRKFSKQEEKICVSKNWKTCFRVKFLQADGYAQWRR
jgi:hypothetical protein